MGEQSVNRFSDPVEKRVFTKHLLDDIKALEIMLQESLFEKGIHRIGAEQELVLVNSNWKPSLMGVEILSDKNANIFMPLYQKQGNDGFFMIKLVSKFWLNLSKRLRKYQFDKLLLLLPGVRRAKANYYSLEVNTNVA